MKNKFDFCLEIEFTSKFREKDQNKEDLNSQSLITSITEEFGPGVIIHGSLYCLHKISSHVFWDFYSCSVSQNGPYYFAKIFIASDPIQRISHLKKDLKANFLINHENFLKVEGVYLNKLTMEMGILLEKLPQSLHDVIESSGELDFNDKFSIAVRIANTLNFAHENHGAIGCLSSEFIFLDDMIETVKLMPIEKNLQAVTNGKLFVSAEKYLFMIEQELAQPEFLGYSKEFFQRTPESDIWSLGLVLYELFAKTEHSEKQREEILKIKNVERKLVFITEWVEKIEVLEEGQSHEEIQKVIRGCLRIKKEERMTAKRIVEILLSVSVKEW